MSLKANCQEIENAARHHNSLWRWSLLTIGLVATGLLITGDIIYGFRFQKIVNYLHADPNPWGKDYSWRFEFSDKRGILAVQYVNRLSPVEIWSQSEIAELSPGRR